MTYIRILVEFKNGEWWIVDGGGLFYVSKIKT
jgi:hypothetical protein